MQTEGAARSRASTGRLSGASARRSLHEVASVASRGLPGCAAAAVVVWGRSEAREAAASHPELGRLFELQCHLNQGPVLEARETGQPIAVSDTLRDERWPRYAAAAVRYGVRSLLVLPLDVEGSVVTFALHATRPCTWDDSDLRPLAPLLAAQVAVTLRNADEHEGASPRTTRPVNPVGPGRVSRE